MHYNLWYKNTSSFQFTKKNFFSHFREKRTFYTHQKTILSLAFNFFSFLFFTFFFSFSFMFFVQVKPKTAAKDTFSFPFIIKKENDFFYSNKNKHVFVKYIKKNKFFFFSFFGSNITLQYDQKYMPIRFDFPHTKFRIFLFSNFRVHCYWKLKTSDTFLCSSAASLNYLNRILNKNETNPRFYISTLEHAPPTHHHQSVLYHRFVEAHFSCIGIERR